jgi:hypothetical protein
MQQVGKKNYKFIVVISFISLYFLIGCSYKNEYPKSIKYFDNNITKDQVLHAVKRVFDLSDKDAFIIDSYRNDLNVTKTKAAYKFYTMDIQNDHFDFQVDKNNSTKLMKATVSIYRTYGVENANPYYVNENNEVYNLFWDRVDYLLGKKENWNSCSFYSIDDFLCDSVDLEDKFAMKKDILDLNIVNDSNTTNEIIKIQSSYTLPNNKDKSSYKNNVNMFVHNKISSGIPYDDNSTLPGNNNKKYKILDNNATETHDNVLKKWKPLIDKKKSKSKNK